jgi:hypothetical protein
MGASHLVFSTKFLSAILVAKRFRDSRNRGLQIFMGKGAKILYQNTVTDHAVLCMYTRYVEYEEN